jgi:transcriptional regulator with XRE-family HTH domain
MTRQRLYTVLKANVRPGAYVLVSQPGCIAFALRHPDGSLSGKTPGMEAEEVPRPFLPWIGRACRRAREERGVHQVEIAAVLKVNQATISRFEEGTAWPRRPEEVLMAYASELRIDVRVLWLHGLVLWLENDPVLDEGSQAEVREALGRLAPEDGG